MKPKLVFSLVYTCSSCGRWIIRLPLFITEGYWGKGNGPECRYGCCASYDTRIGRPYGPRSAKWDIIEEWWDEVIESLPQGWRSKYATEWGVVSDA